MLLVEAVGAYLEVSRAISSRVLAEADGDLRDDSIKAAAGNPAAIGRLFQRYWQSLVKIARARTDEQSAEDAVSDVFMRLSQGKFAKAAAKIASGERDSLWPLLVRSVINAALSKTKAKQSQASGAEIDDFAPETAGKFGLGHGKTTHLSQDDAETVRKVVAQTLEAAKLTPQEKEFLKKLLGDQAALNDLDTVRADEVAAEVWKGVPPTTYKPKATRAKQRFLKMFCGDKRLNDLLPSGRGLTGVSGICGEEIDAFVARLGLMEGVGEPDADATYAAVLLWIREAISPRG